MDKSYHRLRSACDPVECYTAESCAEDGGPLAGARLFVDTGEVLTADDQGAFRLSGLAMKDHALIPVAPGRVRQYILFDTRLRPDCELELRLPRGAIIKGRVLDERGDPVSHAYVTRASSGNALTLNGWDEAAQSDGTFEYGGLSAQRLFYSLQVRAPGYAWRSLSSDVHNETDVIQTIAQLTPIAQNQSQDDSDSDVDAGPATPTKGELPRRTVEGVVQDSDGQPLAGVVVRWGAFMWDSSVKSANSDAAGRYTLARVPAGKGAVLFMAKGYAPQFAPLQAEDKQLNARLARNHGERRRERIIGRARCQSSGDPRNSLPRHRGLQSDLVR